MAKTLVVYYSQSRGNTKKIAQEIGTHDSTGDAMVTVLEGVGQFTIDGVPYLVKPGEALVMPAKKPHSVYAPENFKWMLTVIFPHNN